MSMEKEYTVNDTHCRSITAIGSSAARRELYLGFEDGQVKSIEVDSGEPVQTYWEHKGWISSFLYWPTPKLMLCASNDGMISAIGAGGNLMDRVLIGTPVYAMSLNRRRRELVLGVTNGIQFHALAETKEGVYAHYINAQAVCFVREHTDIVRCVVTMDARIYTAGYDGSLVIYECHYKGIEDSSATKTFKHKRAHDAGISCLLVEKESDKENSDVLVFTTGFDKTVKVWTADGKLIHKFYGFQYGITGLCYIPKNKTICFVSGSAYIYDPKSGDDVTNFIDTFVEETQSANLQLLKYVAEYGLMLATTSRRQLLVYKYNASACLTSLKCRHALDSVCFTRKTPVLFFTGDSSGLVQKWEQKELCQLVHDSETLLKSEFAPRESSRIQGQTKEKSESKILSRLSNMVIKLLYVESLDLLLAACEDGNIYVWGIDQEGVSILKNMNYFDQDDVKQTETKERGNSFDSTDETIEFSKQETAKTRKESELVTNRVAGFVLKSIFCEHTSCVTSLVVVEKPDGTYLLSAGWDRRVCIWDLNALRLYDVYRNKHAKHLDDELAVSDANILDMCMCERYDWFAYACTDATCYVRRFSTCGTDMMLVNTLRGHLGDVNCVRWSHVKDVWLTGSEDHTIRIWAKDGKQIEVINCMGTVNSICFDLAHDILIAACHDIIKIFEMETFHLVQSYMGHHDSIRDVCFIPERNHIVSVSWDRTVRVWRSYRKRMNKRKPVETESEKKFETWVLDQMKIALKNINSFDHSTN